MCSISLTKRGKLDSSVAGKPEFHAKRGALFAVFDTAVSNMMDDVSAALGIDQLLVTLDAREQESIRGLLEAIAQSGPDAIALPHDSGTGAPPVAASFIRCANSGCTVLAQGGAVSVLPADRMLTSQEAANCLSLSRTYLVRLLDEGKIPFERVGRHRRVALADSMTFEVARRRQRRQHLRNLIELSEQYGLYDQDEDAMRHLAKLGDAERGNSHSNAPF